MSASSQNTFLSPPKLVLGPIIGTVTDTSARVLIEIHHFNEITCSLISPNGSKINCTRTPEKGFPTVFKFHNLQPKTLYRVYVDNLPPLNSQFRTLRTNQDQPGNLNVAIVSCNEISKGELKNEKTDLWVDLSKRVNQLDYILHIGDQCYLDMGDTNILGEKTPYEACKEMLDRTPKEQWPALTTVILEIMRAHYRRTWGLKSTASVLANVPNLMILDDHEVRDDWGWRQEDYDPQTLRWDYFYGQLARKVYYEYQRQLRDDIDWNNLGKLRREYYDFIANGVGIAMLDYRGSRSWFREDKIEETELGMNQTNWIKDLFSPQGRFRDVNSVLFVSPLPVAFLSDKLTRLTSKVIDDSKEHWTYKNSREMGNLLDVLRNWKISYPGREITLLGGDVHVGIHTDIYYQNELVFKQFTSSAINNQIVSKFEVLFMKAGLQLSGKIDGRYSFKHRKVVRQNNYGLIWVRSEPKDRINYSNVECLLILSEDSEVIPETNKWAKDGGMKKSLCGCNASDDCNLF